ncbi:hypothetical protein DICPUDRAFT_77776 [Dictyostelium purpureum]|uniref:HCP-like protein n=1 Tax=Dictyostelium purpureum TaxID=5786 RepID=F0ZHK6_DICPU|nr:uncharacterized protein DICPUDRAFT_77776 [Dictyostelium purpureum]EGC36588.1 hypothetical protein DICPUDRAFT_77776 [Dictyostelium purpureum]|eukprot:XP_003286892.1 hypothetical protein DICPUDRAFT_77776 [Dictyostelium purpureum]
MDNINLIDNDNDHLAPPPLKPTLLKKQPQRQQRSNQSSLTPPPLPSLVLPVPTMTLIKKNHYESRSPSTESDIEFKNSLSTNPDIKVIKKLAERGHSSSQAWRNDRAKIEFWLEKSSNLGYEEALATYSVYLHDGTLNYHNYQKAFNLFKLSASLGVDNNCSSHIGICFYEGHGHVVDYNEAYKFFYIAAQQNNESISFFYLAQCLYYGHGVERNYELAAQWFQKSSDAGYGIGSNGLGLCYLRGHGVQQDFPKAKDIFNIIKHEYPDLDVDINLKTSILCMEHRYEPNEINNFIQENLQQPIKPKSSKSALKAEKSKKHTFGLSSNTAGVLGIVSSTLDAGYQF